MEFGALPNHRFRECYSYRQAAPHSAALDCLRTLPLEFLGRHGASLPV